MSLRDDTFSADDLATEDVTVGGRTYRVRECGADAAVEHYDEVAAERERLGKEPRGLWVLSRLIVRCVVDPDTGALVFDQPGDADALLKKSQRLVLALGNAANRVCYAGGEAKKASGESTAVPSSAPSTN